MTTEECHGTCFDVIGFGSLNVDYIYSLESLSSLPDSLRLRPGHESSLSSRYFKKIRETMETHGRLKTVSGGGSAANTVLALARMGFKTAFVGKVGRDETGDFLLKSLEGTDCSYIQRGSHTGVCLIAVDGDKDRSILVFPNANNAVSIRKRTIAAARKARFVHFSSFVGKRSLSSQITLAASLPSEVKLAFDPGEVYADRGLADILPIIQRSFIVFVTEAEVRQLTEKDYMDGSREILDLGPSIVACKRGRHGSHIFSRDEEFGVEAQYVPVVDNTGAGDVYDAGFIAGLLSEWSLGRCALFATRAAAKSVTGYGRSTYPSKEDLVSFLRDT